MDWLNPPAASSSGESGSASAQGSTGDSSETSSLSNGRVSSAAVRPWPRSQRSHASGLTIALASSGMTTRPPTMRRVLAPRIVLMLEIACDPAL